MRRLSSFVALAALVLVSWFAMPADSQIVLSPAPAAAGATPGGSDTQVQFNDGGSALGGDAGLTYTKAADLLNFTAAAGGLSFVTGAPSTITAVGGTDAAGQGDAALIFDKSGTPGSNALTFDMRDSFRILNSGLMDITFLPVNPGAGKVFSIAGGMGTTTGGSLSFVAGDGVSGAGGTVSLQGGSSDAGARGSIDIAVGGGGSAPGTITLQAQAGQVIIGGSGGLDWGYSGVRVTTNEDGALTFLGQGDGSDEDLTFDFDTVADVIGISSSTGALKLNFGTLILQGKHNSSDGTVGVTVTTCLSFKDGLCVAGS